MKIEKIAIADLVPYKQNAKDHPPEQIDKLAYNIRKLGFRSPIEIDSNNVIINGHGRRLAMLQLGRDTIDCIRVDDLTEEEIKAHRVADNALAETGYLMDILKNELETFDAESLELTGFDDQMLDDILSDQSIYEEIEKNDANQEAKEIPQMERRLNEHNDYIVFVFRNTMDFMRAVNTFKIKKVDSSLSPKTRKMGLGRILDGKKLLDAIDAKDNSK